MNTDPIYRFKLAYPGCDVHYTHQVDGILYDWFTCTSLQDFINYSHGPFRIEDLKVDFGELNRRHSGDINVFLKSTKNHKDNYGQFFLATNGDKTKKLFVREKYIFFFMSYFEGWDFHHLMWQANDDEYYAFHSLRDSLSRVTYEDDWSFSRVLELVMLSRFEKMEFPEKSVIEEKLDYYRDYGLFDEVNSEIGISNLKDFNHCLMKYFITNHLAGSQQLHTHLDPEYMSKAFNNFVIKPIESVELILRLARYFEKIEFFDDTLYNPNRSIDVFDKFRFPQRFVDPKLMIL
jgi:hypothetical protein